MNKAEEIQARVNRFLKNIQEVKRLYKVKSTGDYTIIFFFSIKN